MNAILTEQKIFDTLDVPMWKRAPLPNGIFEQPIAKAHLTIEGSHTKVSVKELNTIFEEPSNEAYQNYWRTQGSHQKSLGKKIESYISGFSPNAQVIVSKARNAMPSLKLSYYLNETGHNYLLEHLIIAEEGSKLEVILDLSSGEAQGMNYFGQTKIVAKAGAQVKFVKVQRLLDSTNVFDTSVSVVDEGGQVEVVELQLGGGYKAVSYESELMGRRSVSDIKSAYYAEGSQKLDLSYTMSHFGKQTESNILVKGAMTDAAQKVFRGNLFFSRGAPESVGREREFVTLFSEHAKSDSFPALMCSEDDVIGEHAASIGQVDPDALFYIMSRGYSEQEAKRLMLKASFEEITRNIGDVSLEALVLADVDRRLL